VNGAVTIGIHTLSMLSLSQAHGAAGAGGEAT
jgi:hypothetical protein